MEGFIKYMRSEEAINLHSNKNANHLLSIIAFRASRKGNPVLGVKPGEALLGDYRNYNLTRQQYRTALNNLQDWGYINHRVTNKGTIAMLLNSAVYNINSEEGNHQITIKQPSSNHQTTIKQPSGNHQVTTIKKERIKESKKERKKAMDDFSFLNPTELLLQSKPLPFSPAINEKLTAFLSMNRIANINSLQTYEKLIADQIKTHGETHVLNVITQGTLANWKSLQVKYFKKENDNDVPMGYLPEFKTGYEKKLYLRKRLMAYAQYAKTIEGFNHEYNCRYSRTLTKDNTTEYIKIINELDELFPILKEHK